MQTGIFCFNIKKMWFTILYIILALGADGAIFYFTGLYNYPYFYWVPVLAFPILYVLVFGLSLLILLICSLPINVNKEVKKPSKFARFLVTQIVRQINFFSFSIVKRSGFYKIPHDEPYVIIYNHVSNFDPMFIMDYLHKDKIICVTKPSNKKIPIAGPYIHKAGYISINREDPKEGTKAILKAVEYIQKGYGSIAIAPEGTRMKDGHLGTFHPGSLQVAYHSHAPIVVCGFKGTGKLSKNAFKKPSKINMDILEVYRYENYQDITPGVLTNQIVELYKEYLKEE